MNKNKQAFTLIELIVVLIIIAILGTIAFISLQGYSRSARDSTRVSDIQNMKTSLELFQTNSGKYPDPTNGTQIIYLGAEVWTQGIFGEQTFTNVGKLNKLPKDPLTEREYAYSVLNTKLEYEIGAIYESDDLSQNINNEIIKTTYAGTKKAIGMITGNYNGILAKVSTGSTLYTLAVPSIITTTLTSTDLLNIVINNNLVYNGFNNLPSIYDGTKFNTQSSEPLVLVNPANLVIFSGSIENLSTGTGQIAFVNGLQSAYTGTTIAGLDEIGNILSYDTVNDIEGSQLVAKVLIQHFIDPSLVISGVVAGGGEEEGETSSVPLLQAMSISAGTSHTCALLSTGGVKCWGYNYYGQLGDGTTTNKLVPTQVAGLTSGISSISVGGLHTCALTTGGGVKCWGYNLYGQLGDGTSGTNRLTFVDVIGLSSGILNISLGIHSSCALTTGGGVKCWGYNAQGQLGDGTTVNKSVPTQVSGLTSGISSISVGGNNACILNTGGGVKCWGNNLYGQLGDGTMEQKLVPTQVSGLESGVSSISLGGNHTCALTTTGGVKCWGYNDSGQLGDGSKYYTQRLTPVESVGLLDFTQYQIKIGEYSCIITTSGGVKCWGYNATGQLGDGTTLNKILPTDVEGLTSGVSAISIGNSYTCALTNIGGVKCWGNNAQGQLGDNTTVQKLIPTQVSGLTSGVSAVSIGGNHTCALTTTGGVKCWGYNPYGQIGDNTIVQKLIPTQVSGLTSGISAISLGGNHTCALTTTGGVKCWGYNPYGQLGDNTTTNKLIPTQVTGLTSGISHISLGNNHTCALTTTGGVKCWGDNTYGQLGDGTEDINRLIPVDVIGLSNVSNIYGGNARTCAKQNDGVIQCWGSSGYGLFQDGYDFFLKRDVVVGE